MSIRINKDNGTAEQFTVVLSTREHKHYGEILNVTGLRTKVNLSSANEINFTVNKYTWGENGIRQERLWDKIKDFQFVWVKELNEYYEIYVANKENSQTQKVIIGTSACECELSNKILYNVEINTETDMAIKDYVPTTFCNMDNPKASLLHRVLEVVPAYSIGHVDESLLSLKQTSIFSVDDKSVYDFLMNDVANEFHCLFLFDSVNRTISVYDLYTTCNGCGNRGDFTDVCPECGSSDLSYFGQDTTILVSANNLTEEITLEINKDNVKNVFKLEAGDDLMTAAVKSYIPTGSDRIFYISEDQMQEMPPELVARIKKYNALYESKIEDYNSITREIYHCLSEKIKYESKMMPDVPIEDATATTEAVKLNKAFAKKDGKCEVVALENVTESTSLATVNSAIINYSKVFINSGVVKVEVDTGNWNYKDQTEEGMGYGKWTGKLKLIRYANKEDIAYTDNLELDINDDYPTFIQEKIQKNISQNDTDDGSVYNVLEIDDLGQFETALKEYCLSRLESFYEAIKSVLAILQSYGEGDVNAELYSTFYNKYNQKLKLCEAEKTLRQATIDEWVAKYEVENEKLLAIQEQLDFEKYLGTELYKQFTNYIRESKFTNSNYFSDGLTEDERFERALQFMDVARKELIVSSHYQHSLSANMYNLLLMDEFKPIVDKFELGNWIRVQIDDSVYRLRLISYEIDFDNLGNINTDFSDVTKTANGMSDIHDILKQASSMSSTYSYVANQASKGNEAQTQLIDFTKEGLNSALINIKSNDNEEVVFDNNGLWARTHDDITGEYSPEQLRVTHNILCFTDDNWETVSTALGKHDYYKYVGGILKKDTGYGLSAQFVTAGYVNGSQIIGGEIYSQNYSSTAGTYINLNSGSFSFAGGALTYNGSDLKLSNGTIFGGSININNKFIVDNQGNVTLPDSYLTANQINSTFATIKNLDAVSVKVNQVEADYIAADKVVTDSLTANYIAADKIVTDTLTANYIAADKVVTDSLTANYIAADKVVTDVLTAKYIEADEVIAQNLKAATARISSIESDYVTTGTLTANYATIDNLNTLSIQVNRIDADYASVDSLSAVSARIDSVEADYVTASEVSANYATIANLNATNITVNDINADYVKASTLGDDVVTSISGKSVYLGSIQASGIINANMGLTISGSDVGRKTATIGGVTINYWGWD